MIISHMAYTIIAGEHARQLERSPTVTDECRWGQEPTQKTRDPDSVLVRCWASVIDGGQTNIGSIYHAFLGSHHGTSPWWHSGVLVRA